MNILIPFNTPNTQALTKALRIVARGEFTCTTDFSKSLSGQNPAFHHTVHDLVLVDLDAFCPQADDAMSVAQSASNTMERLRQMLHNCTRGLVNNSYTFMFFSQALVNGLASADTESFNSLQTTLEETMLRSANKVLLQPQDELGLPVLAPWDNRDMARLLAVTAQTQMVAYASLNQKEITSMLTSSPHLTASAKAKMNDLLPSSDGLRFSFDNELTVYQYSNVPGELRQRSNLLSMSLFEFFEPNSEGLLGRLQVLESFVLRCPYQTSRPGDIFEATFAKFLEAYTPELLKVPETVAAFAQPPKPGARSHWNSPECDSGFTGAVHLTTPEDVSAIKVKYAALMTHIEHVKRWIGLFTQLSAEDKAFKEGIFNEVALPHSLSHTVEVTLKFSVKDLFTDQFLSAKQDGAYLGVVLSASPQTELEFVSIRCAFRFD